jgi:uncharacterized protein (DUF3084 family)
VRPPINPYCFAPRGILGLDDAWAALSCKEYKAARVTTCPDILRCAFHKLYKEFSGLTWFAEDLDDRLEAVTKERDAALAKIQAVIEERDAALATLQATVDNIENNVNFLCATVAQVEQNQQVE